MTPEKTHSQNPCCLPSWEERLVWPQQPPPPVEDRPSFSTEMVFGCHAPMFLFFHQNLFFVFVLHLVCQSLSVFIDSFLAARALSSQEVALDVTFHQEGEALEAFIAFFLCHLQAKESLSYICPFALKSQKPVSKLTVFSSPSLPLFKNKRRVERKEKKR